MVIWSIGKVYVGRLWIISQYLNATGEAFSPHKRTSSTSKQEVSKLLFYFCGSFSLLGSVSGFWISIYWADRIRIQSVSVTESETLANMGFCLVCLVMRLSFYRTQYRVTVRLKPQPLLSLPNLAPFKCLMAKCTSVFNGLFLISHYLNANIHGGILGPVEQIVWRASAGVIHCVFDQISNLQNCFTTPNKNLERGGGLSQISTCLYR